jgi:pimeloyl-ACP methyl ester carboxylesterase
MGASTGTAFRRRTVQIHGHDVTFRMAGEGPTVVLVHGMAGSSMTWRAVMPTLAERFTVVAPDLLGHGMSAKPRGDYSLGAYASGIRDLLVVLEQERATVVGHSLGGGIAMQFAYQFPDLVERLALIASGGLGKEVSPLLKAVTLPGAEYVIPLLLHSSIRELGERPGSWLRRLGWRPNDSLADVWRSYTTLTDRAGQQAFINTVRSVIDVGGQRVSAYDRLYLAQALPTLIVWGDRDRVIPVTHAYDAANAIPGARLEIVEGAGHFLPSSNADRLFPILVDFLNSTEPARVPESRWRGLMVGG